MSFAGLYSTSLFISNDQCKSKSKIERQDFYYCTCSENMANSYTYSMTMCYFIDVTVIWAGGRTNPPSDKPKCGWENELCSEQERKGKGFVNCNLCSHAVS